MQNGLLDGLRAIRGDCFDHHVWFSLYDCEIQNHLAEHIFNRREQWTLSMSPEQQNAPRVEERVVALAGRRISDAETGETGEFMLAHISAVAERIRAALTSQRASTVVGSAANGADIIGLCVARELGIRFHIVLPFDVDHFRKVSVVDRPGDELWGWLYDSLVQEARSRDDLILLGRSSDDDAAFDAANERVVDEARHLAKEHVRHVASADSDHLVTGIAVWNGKSYGERDKTASFCNLLRRYRIPMMTISIDGRDIPS